jgi:hypothetical protein
MALITILHLIDTLLLFTLAMLHMKESVWGVWYFFCIEYVCVVVFNGARSLKRAVQDTIQITKNALTVIWGIVKTIVSQFWVLIPVTIDAAAIMLNRPQNVDAAAVMAMNAYMQLGAWSTFSFIILANVVAGFYAAEDRYPGSPVRIDGFMKTVGGVAIKVNKKSGNTL